MNASGRPNTCKSRGSGVAIPPATGVRVRNAYVTHPQQGDNPEKFGLIPHIDAEPHDSASKDLLVTDGHA